MLNRRTWTGRLIEQNRKTKVDPGTHEHFVYDEGSISNPSGK